MAWYVSRSPASMHRMIKAQNRGRYAFTGFSCNASAVILAFLTWLFGNIETLRPES
jgi:hypothetical protein